MTTKISTKTDETPKVQSGFDTFSKTVITLLGSISLMVGLWSGACIINAMVSRGLIEVVKGWVSAVFGI